ncbi:hypothetical protein FHR81_001090 [Actinoalloteichus hoggarensis]|nr:hypothetical protein [Actinoalloteichus hoggarensis]
MLEERRLAAEQGMAPGTVMPVVERPRGPDTCDTRATRRRHRSGRRPIHADDAGPQEDLLRACVPW